MFVLFRNIFIAAITNCYEYQTITYIFIFCVIYLKASIWQNIKPAAFHELFLLVKWKILFVYQISSPV